METPNSKRTIIFTIVLIIILAVAFGLLWWRSTSAPGNGQGASATTGECQSGTTNYETTEIGVGFCYPTGWGSVTVSDATFASGDAGNRWRIAFSAKPQVHAGLATTDWTTTVPRDGTCVDPGSPTIPERGTYVTSWRVETETEGQPSSAYRGIARDEGDYIIIESISDLLNSGVCIEGYKTLSMPRYNNAGTSYYVDFNDIVTTPAQHMSTPNVLVSEADREAFIAFTQSFHALD